MKVVMGAVIACACFFAGCTSKKDSLPREESEGRRLNLAIRSPIRSLDPRVGNDYPSAFVIRMLYEGLMRMGEDGQLVPGIAKSYEISEDQRTYTFYLRDAEWSNGEFVTAYDFEYAWKKVVDPRFTKAGAFTFYAIKNVEACLQGRVDIDQVGIRAVDDKTLVVELEHCAPYFVSLTSCPTFMPINKRMDLKRSDWANRAGADFVCNGPFTLREWRKGNTLTLQKNQKYWSEEDVALPSIQIMVVENIMTQFYLFEQGKIDWIGSPLSGMIPSDILKDKKVRDKLQSREAFALYWYFVNTETYPMGNKNLRKALAYAINREEIAKYVLQMGEKPAMGILPSGLSLSSEPYFDDGNLERAREHFNSALQELGLQASEFPKIVLSTCTGGISACLNQAIQQQWYEALGIDVQLERMEWPVHLSKLTSGNFMLGEAEWVSWLYDPIYLLETFRIKSRGINMSHWEHSQYRHLLDLSDSETDEDKRRGHLRQAESLLMEELPVIPICFTRTWYMGNPKLKGVCVSPLKDLDFRWAYFEE